MIQAGSLFSITLNKNAMITLRKICLYLTAGMLLLSFAGCGAEKETSERRNYMMPRVSELPRNSLYKETHRKKVKASHKKKRKAKRLF